MTVPAPALASSPDRVEAQAELQAITEALNDLDAWLGTAERKRNQWQREIQASDREVARLSRQVDAAAEALARLRSERETLQAEQAKLEAERQRQARRIGEHLASAYRMSGDDFVKLLLNQQSPDTVDRMVRYHRYFSAARLESLSAYRETLQQLAENAEQLDARTAEVERRQRALTSEQQTLVAKREERRTLLARLETEARGKESERQRLIRDRERLEALLAELERRAEALDGRAFADRKGSLPWPVSGRVQNAFGQARSEGRLVWHGLLVEADEGTPVSAVFRGRVVFADWLRGFGLLTIIDHGSGYMTLYGQADTLAKKPGDWVEAGEVIARAGRSGGTSTSGLYFEIRHDGRPTDPVAWLSRRPG